ncbi:hypothetical protein FA13DRAFT_1519878 [Coprinellus micaceus]|uniref:Uncharacterized protein n=1 Tax=Coprinellus micaceus TaxID=71717 RepID=A0A4Y7SK18_COPMI|nr:hypothetical protein FA13DRAFT_1519878 [Coprinellus micaceus]
MRWIRSKRISIVIPPKTTRRWAGTMVGTSVYDRREVRSLNGAVACFGFVQGPRASLSQGRRCSLGLWRPELEAGEGRRWEDGPGEGGERGSERRGVVRGGKEESGRKEEEGEGRGVCGMGGDGKHSTPSELGPCCVRSSLFTTAFYQVPPILVSVFVPRSPGSRTLVH